MKHSPLSSPPTGPHPANSFKNLVLSCGVSGGIPGGGDLVDRTPVFWGLRAWLTGAFKPSMEGGKPSAYTR